MNHVKAVEAFLKGGKQRRKQFGQYHIRGNSLVFVAWTSDDKWVDRAGFAAHVRDTKAKGGHYTDNTRRTKIVPTLGDKDDVRLFRTYPETNEVMRRVRTHDGEMVLGNASILPLVGRRVNYGHVRLNRTVAPVQREMERLGVMMIPFSVFADAGLDLNEFKLIHKCAPETIKVKVTTRTYDHGKNKYVTNMHIEDRHFVGAALFEVDGKQYLFDVDRRGAAHRIFNPFLAQLRGRHATIAEAYQSLKPAAVRRAEQAGLKVRRQGEWYFIPTPSFRPPKMSERDKLLACLGGRPFHLPTDLRRVFDKATASKLLRQARKKHARSVKPGTLRAGTNSPNTVQRSIQVGRRMYVSGLVEHSGREHADLQLKGWHRAVPNTSVRSFTLTGDVD